mgnify:CR=1 FL=1
MSSFRPRVPSSSSSSHAWQQAATASIPRSGNNGLARPLPHAHGQRFKWFTLVIATIVVTNLITHFVFNPGLFASSTPSVEQPLAAAPGETLFLMDKAKLHVVDGLGFEAKVREIADMLDVPPEWLMAVMYSESKFDAAVENYRGSGATGLIQFMPATAAEMNVSLERLKRMSHVQQLEYVYLYLQTVRERYGEYNSLTDLYLAILYPKALGQDFCYTLYAHPTKAYRQNSGLDENKDRHVTVSDIDRRMKRLFPTAYMAAKVKPKV